MRSILRDVLELLWTYALTIITTIGWVLFGLYIYSRPVPPNPSLGPEFNHEVGAALVAQGLIVFAIFSIGGALRTGHRRREQEEVAKDRQMLREMYQWMGHQRSKGE